MTPDEELKILKADWAALVAQVSGGEGANLRRDETHPNSGGIAMSKEIMQQALDALVLARDMSYGEFCNISAAIDALRAALAAPQGEPACPHIRSSGPADRATHWCALAATPPAALSGEEEK